MNKKRMRADYDIMCRINESIDMNKRTAQFLHSAKKKPLVYLWLETSDCKWHEFPFQFAQ